MKNLSIFFLALVLALSATSCYTLEHTVGNGAQTGVSSKKQQWYALWGLVPLNDVDSKSMAGGAADYTIKSQHTFLDLIISGFTNFVTVNVKTVEVTK